MHFSFSLLRIKGLYMFGALRAYPQEVLHKRHVVYCVRIISVDCGTVPQPTDIRTQFTKCRLYSASWGWASNPRNMQRHLILNQLNEMCITLVSLYRYTDLCLSVPSVAQLSNYTYILWYTVSKIWSKSNKSVIRTNFDGSTQERDTVHSPPASGNRCNVACLQ
jgi:hypothetical protein